MYVLGIAFLQALVVRELRRGFLRLLEMVLFLSVPCVAFLM